ncbi:MAG: peptidoglycan-binding protein [Myxococcales bacterium]|nr:peptidoglycan-binding protein [Myxococcales bacterium]
MLQNDTVAAATANSAAAPSATNASPASLRVATHSEGTAALSAAVPRPRARPNLLTGAQEQTAIRYNRGKRFSRETIRGYQNVVRTPDDGDFGPNTVEAIARFQSQNGLEVDGKIGPATKRTLDAQVHHDAPTPNQPEPEPDADPQPVRDGGLTAHFALNEFRSKDGAGFPRSVIPVLRELAENLEVLRAEVGPIGITSGYRSPAHNRAVGGAKNSYHVRGMAADITVAGMTPRQVRAKVLSLIASGRMKQGGIGLYSTFVHYDTRGYAARW